MTRLSNAGLILGVLLLISTANGYPAEFRNLGFEEGDPATAAPDPFSDQVIGPVEGLLPGWTLSNDLSPGKPVTVMRYNSFPAGLGYVTLFGGDSNRTPAHEGRFSLAVSGANIYSTNTPTYYPISVVQKGTVPVDAKSIRFISSGAPWELTLDGAELAVSYQLRSLPGQPLADPANPYSVRYGYADVSEWAGKDVELKFTTRSTPVPTETLDSIVFLDTPVIPEPGTLSLTALGCWMLVRQVRKRARQ